MKGSIFTILTLFGAFSASNAAFNIQLVNTGNNTDFDAAFVSAKARWESIIIGDLNNQPSIGVDWFRGQLSASHMGDVDDVVIGYELKYIDGISGVLGSAGPYYYRTSTNSTVSGGMKFDQDDFANMSAANAEIIILHEMGKSPVLWKLLHTILLFLHSLNIFEL